MQRRVKGEGLMTAVRDVVSIRPFMAGSKQLGCLEGGAHLEKYIPAILSVYFT